MCDHSWDLLKAVIGAAVDGGKWVMGLHLSRYGRCGAPISLRDIHNLPTSCVSAPFEIFTSFASMCKHVITQRGGGGLC